MNIFGLRKILRNSFCLIKRELRKILETAIEKITSDAKDRQKELHQSVPNSRNK